MPVASPHISPIDAKIAQDFRCAPSLAHTLRASCGRPNLLRADLCRQRVPATESIAVVDVRPPWRTGHPADVQICSRQICMVEGQIVRTDDLHGDSRPQGCAQGWAQ